MRFINTEYSLRNIGHYSPGVLVGSTLYVSGQLSIDPITGVPPKGGLVEETKQALKNLETVLHAAGAKKENVAMCRVYISNVDFWTEMNGIYGEFFGNHKPARIVVPSNKLHNGCLIEIEAIVEMEIINED